jgi:CRP-like cAMP-binding protein
MKARFIEVIKSIIPLPVEQETAILNISSIKRFRKGEYFLYAGEVPATIGFNLHGLFRYYYIDSKGNDFTKGFFPEGAPVTSYSALIQGRGSYFHIEALEDSVTAVIRYSDWKVLMNRHGCWKDFLIAMLEKGYTTKESREREFLLLNAEERYQIFRHNFPNIELRVKQHYIASYLGITPVALSRIRKKMGLVNPG